MKDNAHHEPVLLKEAVDALHIKNQAQYIDATLGGGGHSREIAQKGGIVLGIETDPHMLELAKKNLEGQKNITLAHGNFRDIKALSESEGFKVVQGILFDLGVSSVHFEDAKRGFSFKDKMAPLDMRLDPESQAVKASDLLKVLRGDQLRALFAGVLGSSSAQVLTNRILSLRANKPIETVGDLIKAVGSEKKIGKIHPATKAFMALRITVNSELENIKSALPQALELLDKKGRLVVISFHSLEDEIIKDFFKNMERDRVGKIITKTPILPTEEEVARNPRSRSAKLRILEKI